MEVRSRRGVLAGVGLAIGLAAAPAQAQWSTVYEQFHLPASHNWAFRQNFNAAERLFYAFDYGHAILYETLWTRPGAPESLLEERIYDRLTRRVLVRPPRLPLEEAAIEVEYAKLVPEAKIMFDWAHMLHRQTYDVWADERIPLADKDRHMAEVLAYYRSRPDIAFSTVPKSMELMDGQHYSLAFRERFPKFNGLIWAYHWLQIGLYEPLVVGRSPEDRQAGVRSTVARFWQMLGDPPASMPYLMPMTAAIAPTFAARYPEISIVFDNLHMMHDVVSDILASERVPRDRKRAEILRAVELFRDDTSYVTTFDEWRQMAVGMGVHNQGGPAVGFLPELPRPTVPRGMSMAGMDHAQMDHGAHTDGGDHHDHGAHEDHRAHAGHRAHGVESEAESEDARRLAELLARLLDDPQLRARVHADPELHRLWADPAVQRHLGAPRPAGPRPAEGAGQPPPRHDGHGGPGGHGGHEGHGAHRGHGEHAGHPEHRAHGGCGAADPDAPAKCCDRCCCRPADPPRPARGAGQHRH